MPQSQSNLTSLASLLENAEARHTSSMPPPKEPTASSGLIDLEAIQKRARDERAALAAKIAERTPVPVVTTMPGIGPHATTVSDPEIVEAMVSTQRRKKHVMIGAIAGGAALLLIAIGVSFSGSSAPPPAAAVAPPPVAHEIIQTPPAPPPAAPVVEAHAADPAPVASPAVASAPTKGTKAKRKHAKPAKGPKMTKVVSGGT